jgi:hypothetical protein
MKKATAAATSSAATMGTAKINAGLPRISPKMSLRNVVGSSVTADNCVDVVEGGGAGFLGEEEEGNDSDVLQFCWSTGKGAKADTPIRRKRKVRKR